MPNPLSPYFSKIFTDKKHQTLLNGLIQHFNWNCVEVFKAADNYPAAIEAFTSFYSQKIEDLQAKNLFAPAGDLFEALQTAQEAHEAACRENDRLRLKEIADNRSASWRSAEPLVSDQHDIQKNEGVISQVYQATSEVPVGEDNAFFQKEIDLFAKLVQSAGSLGLLISSKAAFNADIQNAITQQDTFALLEAWLKEVNPYESGNSQLKQSLIKALITAFLLLNKPILKDNSEYTDLLGFLLQQTPVDENLVLDVIKLQVKICLLAGDDLAETQEFLSHFLAFKDQQGEENVPILGQAFFDRLEQLLKDINLYQEEGRQFLDELRELNAAQSFFDLASDNEEEAEQQYFAFVESYTKDLLSLNGPVSLQAPVTTASDQVATSQIDSSSKAQASSPEEQGKQEFVAKLLTNAKQVTAKTSGKSRDDIEKLLFLNEQYYAIEPDKSARKAFLAELIKNAAAGLVFPLKEGITLSQYLASAQLDSQDKRLYIIMYCRFFRAVIKQHASNNTLTVEEYKKILMPLLGLLTEKTEPLVTQQVLLFASLDLDKTLQVIHAKKAEKGQVELMSQLVNTVAIHNLPSFRLLTQLHPEAKQLFAMPEFVPIKQTIDALATKDDIHMPLLLLLKFCLFKKEKILADKVLLLCMALKNPSQAHHSEIMRLLSQDKSHQERLKNLAGIPLNSFADYQALLREAAKTNDVDLELIGKLFDVAMAKAKDTAELLSLASVCKENAVLVERLAKTLFSRFPQLEYLKTLMKRVNCSAVVAKIADEEIKKQISSFKVFTTRDYQRLIAQASYPNGVESAVKGQLIQDYFVHCQRHGSSKADYDSVVSEFVHCLIQHESLPWFIQLVLPEIIQKTLAQVQGFAKTEPCEKLLEFIEKYIAPKINQSPVLTISLNKQREVIGRCWLEQLAVCRDQVVLSEDLLAQRHVLDGEKTEGQPFDLVFDEVIKSTQKIEIPTLTDLQKTHDSITILLNGAKEEKDHIAREYAKSEKNYQTDLEALVENHQTCIQNIDKKREELRELRQQVTDKKVSSLATFEEIKTNLIKFEFPQIANTCKAPLDEVATQFKTMTESTEVLFNELIVAKESQALALQELTTLLNDEEPLSPEKMRALRVKQQDFNQAKQAINQLATQIQAQVDIAQRSLFEQTMSFKNTFGQGVGRILQQHNEIQKQQIEGQTQISNAQHRQEEIKLELQAGVQKKSGVEDTIKLQQTELEKKEQELAKLSKETLEPVSKKIHELAADSQFKASIQNFIGLFKEAIANRHSARYSAWAQFKQALAEWVVSSPWLPGDWITEAQEYINARAGERSSSLKVKFAEFVGSHEAYFPPKLVAWAQEVRDDFNHKLPSEIRELTEQLGQLETIEKNLISSTTNEQNKTYASEIRGQVAWLLNRDLKIKNDQRASLLWQWSTNRALDKFLQDNQELEASCKTLSETQARIDGLMVANKTAKDRIETLRKQPLQLIEDMKTLNMENNELAEKLTALVAEQAAAVKNLNDLHQQHGRLSPLYSQIISLVESPIVDILYDPGLDDNSRLNRLKDCIERNKNSLSQDGTGDGVFANVVYHAVRRGTVEMVAHILAVLSEGDCHRYLTTAIFDGGVATTPLVLAAKRNEQDKMRELIRHGANLNERIFDSNGNETTLLLWAYQQSQLVTVYCLIENGADYQVKDSQGNTLLHFAAVKGDTTMLSNLLKDGVLATKNQNGDDALALLMKSDLPAKKKFELMPMLFERLNEPTRLSGNCFMQVDEEGKNFLHHAAAKGDLNLAKWLLDQPNKELLNAKDKQGQTPLDLAVQAGQSAVVELLFRQSIDLDGVKEVFLHALKQANTSTDMIEVFLKHNQLNLFSDMYTALSDDSVTIFRKWTREDQLQIKASSYDYLTICDNVKNMTLLIDHGANSRATDDLGNTVLHDAVLRGNFEKVQYLIEKCGVEPHPQNKAGVTPLMALYQTGKLPEGTYRQIMNYLIARTSNNLVRLLPGQAEQTLTQVDDQGNTLLHYVAKVGDIEAVNQLIEKKPYFGENPLNRQNKAGETVVHLLIKNKTLSKTEETEVNMILGFLYSEGKVNLHLEDKSGKTPLDYATYISVITFLIEKLPEPIPEVKLMPIAHRVMRTEGLTPDQKKQCIETIARANKRNSTQASWFYRDVSTAYYNSKTDVSTGSLVLRGADAGALSKNDYINSFNSKSADEKKAEFRSMIIGGKAWDVAAILDSQSPPPFPEELNQASQSWLSLATNTELSNQRRNFWVRVLENREKKELTLQDYATGNTLLHALVSVNDKANLFELNQKGVLYVTERDHKNRTVLMLAREQFAQEVKSQPSYTSIANKDQSVYLSVLQSIERRLLGEADVEAVKQIVAELDFSQLTELEMFVSLLTQLKEFNISVENTAFLWRLTDRNGKSLAESTVEAFNGLAKGLSVEDKKLPPKELLEKNPAFARSQSLLINLLSVSQVEQYGQSALGNRLVLCRQEMENQINYFAQQSTYNYRLSEAEIQLSVLKFGKTLLSETNTNSVSERYKSLCEQSVQLRKSTHSDSGQASRTTRSLSSVFSMGPKEAPLLPQQLEEHHAHNMVVYLGLFIEASGIDTMVTLPSRLSAPCASLLALAREKQLPSLYVEIVGRVLDQLKLTNPIAMVQQSQAEAAHKEFVFFHKKFIRFHGAPTEPVVSAVPVGVNTGLRITAD